MATLVKTPAGTWKAMIRRQGWPAAVKTFRTKRDAEDWARRTEDEMVRGVYIRRHLPEALTVSEALDRYAREIVPLKKASTQEREGPRIRELKAFFVCIPRKPTTDSDRKPATHSDGYRQG